MYKLKDFNNEIIEGSFYCHEIEPVIHKDNVYLVEKIIRIDRRGAKAGVWSSGKAVPHLWTVGCEDMT